MKRKLIATILLATCISGISLAQVPLQVETILQREMQERGIPGLQISVVQHGKIVLLRSYGIASIEDAVPVSNRSVFSINSCTKSFTGAAMMQLIEEGKVALDAPASQYLDDLPVAWRGVTIRQLLTHVSGLPDILRIPPKISGGPSDTAIEAETWAVVKTMPMDFTTGEQFSYNQTNYALLGRSIDKLRGKPFAEVFRERQFRVAGMPGTQFGDSHDVIPHGVSTYTFTRYDYGRPLKKPQLSRNFEEFPPFGRTASGLKSTAEDLAHWIIALQQGKLFKTKASLDTLWKAGFYNNGKPTQWALGWVTKPRPRHRAVIMTGGGRAAFFVYPEDDLAIVVLTNLAGASPEEFIDELAGCYNPDIPASDPVTRLHMLLRKGGFENAVEICKQEKQKDPGFLPPEDDLNDWAYRMMSKNQLKEALGILELNVYLYPQSWNVYDSYGEALMKAGRKEAAIRMYQRSIELNPQNTVGKKALEMLMTGK